LFSELKRRNVVRAGLAYNWRAETAYEQDRFLDMLADREKAYSLDPMSLQISADLSRGSN